MKKYRMSYAKLFFAMSLLLLFFRFSVEFEHRKEYASAGALGRVQAWLESSECLHKTGAILSVCYGNTPVPFETVSFSDDIGHTLLGNLVTWIRHSPINRTFFVLFNLFINLFGVLALSGMLLMVGFPWTAAFAIFFGALFGIPGSAHGTATIPGPDVMTAFFGAFCFTAVPLVWCSHLLKTRLGDKKFWIGSTVASLCLYIAILVREPIGLIGIVAALIIIGFVVLQLLLRGEVKRIIPLIALSVVFCIAPRVSEGICAIRDWKLGFRSNSMPKGHGFYHNLLLGLGRYPNKWGFENGDASGEREVKAKNPHTGYATHEYMRVAKQIYLEKLIEDPREVLRLYRLSTDKTLNVPSTILRRQPFFNLRYSHLLIIQSVIGATLLLIALSTGVNAHLLSFFGLSLFNFGFLFQGVLGSSDPWYLWPAGFGSIIPLFLLLDWIWGDKDRETEKSKKYQTLPILTAGT